MLATSPLCRFERIPNRNSRFSYYSCILLIFNSLILFVASGCDGPGFRGLPRSGQLLAATEAGSQSSFPLVPSETKVDLGQVHRGGQASRSFWLTNRSAVPVQVADITSSCDCLRAELQERNLAPGQKVEGRIELDLRKEPQFVGHLGISVKARGKKGETVFAMEIHVAVDGE